MSSESILTSMDNLTSDSIFGGNNGQPYQGYNQGYNQGYSQEYNQGYNQGYGQDNQNYEEGSSSFLSKYGLYILLFVFVCCACSISMYVMRNKCTDPHSMIGWANERWWTWLVALAGSIIFPPLIFIRLAIWIVCSMV